MLRLIVGHVRAVFAEQPLSFEQEYRFLSGLAEFPVAEITFTRIELPNQALQVLAKWEQVSLNYKGSSRGGVADAKSIDGDILINALSLGANYWATKHLRFSANYMIDMFPGSQPASSQTATREG